MLGPLLVKQESVCSLVGCRNIGFQSRCTDELSLVVSCGPH